MTLEDTFEEVYEILSYMDKATVMKIPEEILYLIKNKRNKEYKTRIDLNNIFDEENISSDAVDILCYLEYKYMMDDEERENIDKIKYEIINKEEEEKKKKFDVEKLFKNE